MKLNTKLQTFISSAVVSLALVICCACGQTSQVPASQPPPKLSDSSLQISTPEAKPILALYYLWGDLHVPFILYQDGTVIWATQTSHTGFCIAHLSDAEKKRILALADKVTWSQHYTASKWTHETETVAWRMHNDKIQEVAVYGALPSRADLEKALAERAHTPAITAGIKDLFSTSAPGSVGPPEKVRALVPQNFLALYDEMSCFNHPDARPWLPEKVQLTPKSNNPMGVHDQGISPPSGLPAALFEEMIRTQRPVDLDSTTYSNQIIELIADGKMPEMKVPKNSTNAASDTNGSNNSYNGNAWFHLLIPVPGTAELGVQAVRVRK